MTRSLWTATGRFSSRRELGWLSRAADIEAPDQPFFHPKYMADEFVREQVAVEVVHDLMHFDSDFPLRSFGELERLDVRIDHCPLAYPVAAHSLATVDVAAFHAICPDDVLVHRGEECLHITSVEPVVKTFKNFNFIRHLIYRPANMTPR
jgi:hypothetical protein